MENREKENSNLSEPQLTDSNSEQLNNLVANANPTRDFFEFVLDLVKTGVVVLVLALAVRYFAIQPYIVDGESMMPNYENREYLLAEKISYLFGEPKRGDVVVFRFPGNLSVNYIKRIIGLPGETVEISDNKVKIINKEHPNGITLNEKYIPSNFKTNVPDNKLTKTMRENEYFVLGDNREHSSDSREWGILPKSDIAGRAWLTIAKLGDRNNLPSFYFRIHQRTTYGLSELPAKIFAYAF